MKKIYFLLLFAFVLTNFSFAQLSVTATSTDYTISFDATVSGVNEGQYAGTGFTPSPAAGQIDSDAWATTGMDEGASNFGDTKTTGDFARGIGAVGTTTGGFYAFTVATANNAFGLLPTANDWTPGTITLRIQNNTGSTITEIDIQYNIVVYNNQARSNSFNFAYSSDNSTYTNVTALDFSSPAAADASPTWVTTPKSTTISALTLADGAYFYLRWYGDDVSGSGSRDKFCVDDIVISATSGSTNVNPDITNISISQLNPVSFDTETVYADITDSDGTIALAELHWGTSSGNLTNTIDMIVDDGDTYVSDGTIPAQSDGTTVYYEIYAEDDGGGSTTSAEQSYQVEDVWVSFRVDMAEQTVSGNGVHLAGDFAGLHTTWSPSAIEMTDPDMDMVYTVILLQRANTLIQFKYVNGNSWNWPEPEDVPEACSYPSTDNRFMTTAITDSILDIVCFNSCVTCNPPSYDITFQVNTENISVSGAGMYLAGGFTTWQTNAIAMTNIEGSVWSATVSLEQGTVQEYKFINGDPNAGGSWEDAIPAECTNFGNRIMTVPGFDQTLPPVCFNSCDVCAPTLIISEVADPDDDFNARFVEIYNLGGSSVDFTDVTVYLSRQSNGGATWGNLLLDGTIEYNGKYVVAFDETVFHDTYTFYADQISGIINGNGDDGYFLYLDGDNSTGTLMDAYGVINQDGTGLPWEYLDTKAVRLRSVTAPNPTWTASEWNIPAVAGTLDMTPVAHNEDVDWLGTGSTDWNTKGSNWSGNFGYIPDASFNVTVPSGTFLPTVFGEAACNDLHVLASSGMDVAPNGQTTVYGDLTIDASPSLTLNSDGTGVGTMITYGNVTGQAHIERDISDAEWHLVSSPVSDATANVFYQDFLQMYDETLAPGTNWVDIVDEEEPLVPMVGYALWGVNPIRNTTYDFVGTPNTGIQQFFLTKVNDGWNLVGNPYPSSIDWDSVTIPGYMNGAVYYLQAGTPQGTYVSYNDGIPPYDGSRYVPAMQGFWVSATGPGLFNIDNSVRSHEGSTLYYKNDAILSNYIELEVVKDEMVDKTYIRFKNEATASFDGKYDAYKLMAANEAYPQLFTYAGNDKLSINQLPETNVIPAGFYCGESGNYTIRLAEMNDITSIKLEDLKTGKLNDLEEGNYSFTYTAGENPDRFRIHLGPTSVDTYLNNESVKIYAQGGDIIVSSADPIENSQLRLTDLSGRILLQQPVDNQSFVRLNTNLQTGIYLVTLSGKQQMKTKKIIIN